VSDAHTPGSICKVIPDGKGGTFQRVLFHNCGHASGYDERLACAAPQLLEALKAIIDEPDVAFHEGIARAALAAAGVKP
jgi:hypothetical protein